MTDSCDSNEGYLLSTFYSILNFICKVMKVLRSLANGKTMCNTELHGLYRLILVLSYGYVTQFTGGFERQSNES